MGFLTALVTLALVPLGFMLDTPSDATVVAAQAPPAAVLHEYDSPTAATTPTTRTPVAVHVARPEPASAPRLSTFAFALRRAAKAPDILKVGELKLPGVPKGATGKFVKTGKGLEYEIPSGTPEIDPRVTHVRVMDPVTSGKYQYPNGYAVYMNKAGQTVDPVTGRVIGPSHPFAHLPLK